MAGKIVYHLIWFSIRSALVAEAEGTSMLVVGGDHRWAGWRSSISELKRNAKRRRSLLFVLLTCWNITGLSLWHLLRVADWRSPARLVGVRYIVGLRNVLLCRDDLDRLGRIAVIATGRYHYVTSHGLWEIDTKWKRGSGGPPWPEQERHPCVWLELVQLIVLISGWRSWNRMGDMNWLDYYICHAYSKEEYFFCGNNGNKLC